MQLKHIKTLLPAQEGAAKICAIAWSQTNKKLAVCTFDRVVLLFDEFGEMKDKFSTRPCDVKYGKKSYVVKSMAFSPDATKIAIAQTDDIVWVYRIGEEWGEKKTIGHKFIYKGAVTSLVWLRNNYLFYGTSEGKVRSANTKSNKSSTLYDAKSYVLTMCANVTETGILSGHADGSIVRFYVKEDTSGEASGKICIHPCPPYALSWGTNSFVAAGCDRKIFSYSKEGRILQQFDYSKDMEEKEFTTAVCSPSGQAIVVASFDRLRLLTWNVRKGGWEEAGMKEIKGLYTITALSWKPDATKLYAGSLTGAVEIFDCCLKKVVYKNKYEISYVGSNQVMVKSMVGKEEMTIKSSGEIEGVKVLGGREGAERFVVAKTNESLLIADICRGLVSEIARVNGGTKEKYSFDYENVCLVHSMGELSLVEIGKNDLLASVRTEFTSRHQLSVRLNERRGEGDNKKLAYLLDLKTISIVDLVSGATIATVTSENKVDWLELSETAHKLLFRDRKLKLHLFDVEKQEKITILNYCSYVQWVPESDVVVAQDKGSMCVWYNIEAVDAITNVPIKGDIVDIEKVNGRSEIVIREGGGTLKRHLLDQGVIEFKTAVEGKDFGRAVTYLESLEMTSEAEQMWQQLAALAMQHEKFIIAQRCHSALGDVSKSSYLDYINKLSLQNGSESFRVKGHVAIMEKNYLLAERVFMENNAVEELLDIYTDVQQWKRAIEVAENNNLRDVGVLKKKYYVWLMESNQEGAAAELKEAEEDYSTAVALYCKAGMPAKAARLVTSRSDLIDNPTIVKTVTSSLMKAQLFDKVGELYEKLGKEVEAVEMYRKGSCYKRVVELCRDSAPDQVVKYEEEWGDHLVHRKQHEAAINHFIEAGCTMKAIEASINGHQWVKAVEILEVVDEDGDLDTKSHLVKYYLKLASHFCQVGDYKMAEKFYVKSGNITKAVEMYNEAGKWEQAHVLALQSMAKEQVDEMSLRQAKSLEAKERFKEAEKLYVTIGYTDEAISMYRRYKKHEDMLRMVKQHRSQHLRDTHIYLAKIFESEGKLKLAEHHLVEAKEVETAVNMYCRSGKWEEAYRLAKGHAAVSSEHKVLYDWCKSLGAESALKLLKKLNMFEQIIDYALKIQPADFDFAFEITKDSNKMAYVCERQAEALEEEGLVRQAEEMYIRAGVPKDAVLMYVTKKDWDSAQRVAELYDPGSVDEVLVAQAHVVFSEGEHQRAESLFLRAQRPDLALQSYKNANMWVDAMRTCKEYLPNILPQLQVEFQEKDGSMGLLNTGFSSESTGVQAQIARAQDSEMKGDYAMAVRRYVEASSQDAVDFDAVEKCYKKAAILALNFLSQEDAVRVVEIVAPRLVSMGKHGAASESYMQVGMTKEAITCLMEGSEWVQAKELAAKLEPRLLQYVEGKYKTHLKEKNKIDTLESVDVEAAIETYVDQGEWGRALQLAEKKKSKHLPSYVARYASKLIKDEKPQKAVDLFVRFGVSPLSQHFNIYKRLFYDVVNLPDTNKKEAFHLWSSLRDMFFQLTNNMKTSAMEEQEDAEDFMLMFLIAHFYCTRAACLGNTSLTDIVCMISTALIRHINLIPPDRVFYEAGLINMKLKQDNEALSYFNIFLDVTEAIEEQTLESVDLSVFQNTDVPTEITLPQHPYVPNESHDKVKEWVIAKSMEDRVDTTPVSFPASLIRGGTRYDQCILTGYPIEDSEVVEFTSGKKALQIRWNQFIRTIKTCRDEDMQNVFKFVVEWCGPPNKQ